MSYLIIAILLGMYYVYGATKSVKNTMNTITKFGVLGILLVLAVLTFFKVLQSPPELFIGLAMGVLSYFTLKDLLRLTVKTKSKVFD